MPRFNASLPNITGPVVRVVFQTQTASQLCQFSCDYMATTASPVVAADLVNLAATMKSGMSALFQSILTPDTTLLGTLIEDVSQGTVPTNVDDSWTGIVPSVSGHSLPLEMAATISRQTAVKGQHGYGRISAPAIPISFTNPAANPNLLTGAAQTIYTTFYAGLQGTFTTASRTWNHVLSERPVKPAALVTKAGLVTSFLVRQVLGTARRRKIGRGV